MVSFLTQAAHVCPTPQQLRWMDLEAYAFIHFGMNTFTGREWGDGREPEALFAPTGLDCDQWVRAIRSAGLKGMILTAKHHDGFCLWPSAYTEHSVKNSPCRLDIVREAAEACHRGGLPFGIYLSPWDRNAACYGTPEYNDYYCNQLTELLTQYGDLFCIWFDGACGEGPNGKKQEYDFERYFRLIRKYQPNAVIFSNNGPDVRWGGNEAGVSRTSEWAVIPSELGRFAPVQTGPGPMATQGSLDYLYNADDALGTDSLIRYSKGLVFLPVEYDMSIRPGWFWHEQEVPHSLDRLFETYLSSAGKNACLNLNVPPTKEGTIDLRDVERLKQFGDRIHSELGHPLDARIEKLPDCAPTQPQYRISFSRPTRVRYVVIEEDIAQGQRVENFRITAPEVQKAACYEGTTIGHKHICQLRDGLRHEPHAPLFSQEVTHLLLHITSARDEVLLTRIQVF